MLIALPVPRLPRLTQATPVPPGPAVAPAAPVAPVPPGPSGVRQATVHACPGRLGLLCCTRAEGPGHQYGHTYESTSGVPDRHFASSGGEG